MSMTETVFIDKNDLPTAVSKLIRTKKVEVREANGAVHLIPVQEESIDYIRKLRGSLSKYPELSVEKFLERKRSDKELEL
jgi:hypothetical protein